MATHRNITKLKAEMEAQIARNWQSLTPLQREEIKNAIDAQYARNLGVSLWQFQFCMHKGGHGSSIAKK